MNLVTDMLHPYDLADIRSTVAGLLHDSDSGSTVTWYTPGARSYDPARGAVNNGETSTTFTAFCGPAEVDESKGVKAGDVLVLVPMSDVASPAIDTRFTVGGVAHVVYMVEPAPLSATCSLVYARRVP